MINATLELTRLPMRAVDDSPGKSEFENAAEKEFLRMTLTAVLSPVYGSAEAERC